VVCPARYYGLWLSLGLIFFVVHFPSSGTTYRRLRPSARAECLLLHTDSVFFPKYRLASICQSVAPDTKLEIAIATFFLCGCLCFWYNKVGKRELCTDLRS